MPGTKRTASGVLGGFIGLIGLSAVAGILITATVTPAIAVSGIATSSAINLFDRLPSVLTIDDLILPTTIYAKNQETGKQEVLTSFYDQNRSPVEFDEISPLVFDAILSSEDPRYYQHGGVDLIGTARAFFSNTQGGKTQGGSSISQQYVKNILIQKCEAEAENEEAAQNCYLEATQSSGAAGYERKLQEMRYSIALEQKYSKKTILLGYLNIAHFGGITYGIDAAARYYFNVPAAQLSLGQAAALTGMVQNPNAFRLDEPTSETNGDATGYALTKKRQTYVLGRMLNEGKITQEQHDAAVAEPIVPQITSPKTGCAAAHGAEYFCQYVRTVIENDPVFGAEHEDRVELLRRGGLNVYTSLDWRLQNRATESVAANAPSTVPEVAKFGATAASIEATTGRVLSIAQNTKFSETITNDPNYSSLVFAGNKKFGNSIGFPAGSTFKLFTLIDWLEKGHSVNEYLNGTTRVFPRMTNSCEGDWVNGNKTLVNNFGDNRGYVGTPMRFTRESLNTGFFAMAEQLDLCDIKKVATKMGVTRGTGDEVQMKDLFSVIGSNNVSPIAMAEAFATVANNGTYCQPKVIDSITDSEGKDVKLPDRKCTPVLTPEVAATAAYALQGVMNGGTGSSGNPYDGVPVLGKTGTHQELQTWLVESSTKVATAVWVGNWEGEDNVFSRRGHLRYAIARDVQAKANELYGGDAFPAPSKDLTRTVYTDLPDVVGKTVDEASRILKDAGFTVVVGNAVDSTQPEGVVATQNPGAGKVAGGSSVTISPSTGRGTTVPDVTGKSLQGAIDTLSGAGLANQAGSCTAVATAPANGKVTGTSPPAGSVAGPADQIVIKYVLPACP